MYSQVTAQYFFCKFHLIYYLFLFAISAKLYFPSYILDEQTSGSLLFKKATHIIINPNTKINFLISLLQCDKTSAFTTELKDI